MTKVWLSLFFLCVCPALAQAPVRTGSPGPVIGVAAPLSAATRAALTDLAAQAGVIFAGHVLEVNRPDAAGYVEVRFRIDSCVRGCPKTGTYLLREWAGLWTGQPPRYRIGERRLMLLHARGASGMSSPVNGMEGSIPILPAAAEPIANSKGEAPAEDGTDAGGLTAMTADLRWVQAGEARQALAPVQTQSVPAAAWSGPVAALEGPAASQAQVGTVLALLGALPEALLGTPAALVHVAR